MLLCGNYRRLLCRSSRADKSRVEGRGPRLSRPFGTRCASLPLVSCLTSHVSLPYARRSRRGWVEEKTLRRLASPWLWLCSPLAVALFPLVIGFSPPPSLLHPCPSPDLLDMNNTKTLINLAIHSVAWRESLIFNLNEPTTVVYTVAPLCRGLSIK